VQNEISLCICVLGYSSTPNFKIRAGIVTPKKKWFSKNRMKKEQNIKKLFYLHGYVLKCRTKYKKKIVLSHHHTVKWG
jgi:hypothetical protein